MKVTKDSVEIGILPIARLSKDFKRLSGLIQSQEFKKAVKLRDKLADKVCQAISVKCGECRRELE